MKQFKSYKIIFYKKLPMENADLNDRRIFERFKLELPLSYLKGDGQIKGHVCTHDISAEGVGISSDNELSEGTILTIALSVPDINKELPAQGIVIWSKKLGNCSRAGIKLIQAEIMELSTVLRFLKSHHYQKSTFSERKS